MKKKLSKNQVLAIVGICTIGNAFLILSMTNFFSESFLNRKYLLLYFLIAGSIFTAFKVSLNYLKNVDSEKI